MFYGCAVRTTGGVDHSHVLPILCDRVCRDAASTGCRLPDDGLRDWMIVGVDAVALSSKIHPKVPGTHVRDFHASS